MICQVQDNMIQMKALQNIKYLLQKLIKNLKEQTSLAKRNFKSLVQEIIITIKILEMMQNLSKSEVNPKKRLVMKSQDQENMNLLNLLVKIDR